MANKKDQMDSFLVISAFPEPAWFRQIQSGRFQPASASSIPAVYVQEYSSESR
jgi:hypothetical protein